MSVISFYSNCKGESGNTVSALTYATFLSITKNKRILFISTSFEDDTVKNAFWEDQQNKKRSGLFGPNTSNNVQSGLEGLDRIIRSNKITPEIITDYTNVVLTNRLEILMGYDGDESIFDEMQERYPQIISLASKCYDTVIIDVDKNLKEKTINEILGFSDIVIATTTQKYRDIQKTVSEISKDGNLNPLNTILLLGRYDGDLKFNAKNIARNYVKGLKLINTIPYNSLVFEYLQNGKMIDMILNFITMRTKNESTSFIDELKKLDENIEKKQMDIQMKK